MKRELVLAAVAFTALGQDRLAFEVASVKFHPRYQGSAGDRREITVSYGPQGITFGGLNLGFIISEAYGFPPGRVVIPESVPKETLFGPYSEGYDIIAKADHPVSKDQLRLMLQSLLADRFMLTLHKEARTRPLYKLIVAKDGPKFETAEPGGSLQVFRSPEGFVFRNAEIMRLCAYLSGQVDRTVVDDTSLKGVYNLTVKLPEEEGPRVKSDGRSPDSPSTALFVEALKRLGLQLIAERGPVEYLVIDHVDKPSEN
jgi:uncharacterized protein (TIGR03435 family)